MKKLLLICMLAAALVLAGSGAWANIYTPLQEWYGAGNSTDGWWYTPIANSGDYVFNILGYKKVVTGTTSFFDIFTGWPGPSYTEYNAMAADLTLKSGNTTYMVRLAATGQGQVLYGSGLTYYTSYDLYGPQYNPLNNTYNNGYNGGLGYGGAYQSGTDIHGNPIGSSIPVWALSGTSGTAGVTWTDTGKKYNNIWEVWEVQVNLSDIAALGAGFNPNDFSFFYPTATCANSVTEGQVPICSSVLLLGTGLVGLVGLRWRKARELG